MAKLSYTIDISEIELQYFIINSNSKNENFIQE